MLPRFTHAVGECRRIAQAEIQSLRADGRKNVCGFADKNGAVPGKNLRRQSRNGKLRPRAGFLHLPKKAFESVLQRGHETFRIELHERWDMSGVVNADNGRGGRMGQWHGGAGASLAMQLDRETAMGRAMSEARGDRGLPVGVL